MNKWWRVLCGAISSCFLATPSIAQTVSWRLDNGAPFSVAAGDPINVDVGILTGVRTLRIYSANIDGNPSRLPDADVGRITINGEVGAPGGELRILVARPTDPWPVLPTDAIGGPGLKNLGLDREDGIEVTDTALRKRTRLAAYCMEKIAGNIEVGQVQRIQCGFSDTSAVGTLSANITTYANDAEFGVSSIAYVVAGDSITGTLTAQADDLVAFDEADSTTYASIETVRIGPMENAEGLTGNIFANYGEIREIISSGPIGTDARYSSIYAGVRISKISIRSFNTASDDALLEKPIKAYISCERYSTRENDSSIDLIETNGDFFGNIHLFNVDGRRIGGSARANGRRGIFIGGQAFGEVSAGNFLYADMIARSFRRIISIHQNLRGAIVATGTEGSTDEHDGYIQFIFIGGGFSGAASRADQAPPPYEGLDRDAWFTLPPREGGSVDSVIRASNRINKLDLRTVSHTVLSPGEIPTNRARPRIEAPVIDILLVTNFDSGVVWSGRLDDWTETNQTGNDINNDYARMDVAGIGCVGPLADLWVENLTDRFRIAGDMLGEIHIPRLGPDEILRIGGRFGDLNQALAFDTYCYAPSIVEGQPALVGYELASDSTPRHFWDEVELTTSDPSQFGAAPYARILVQEEDGLQGQVMFDVGNDLPLPREEAWRGDVVIGSGDPHAPPILAKVLSPVPLRATGSDFVAPYYKGNWGGAVGRFPFELSRGESEPFSACATMFCTAVPIVLTNSTGDPIIKLRFYGPVKLGFGSAFHLYKAGAHGEPKRDLGDFSDQLSFQVAPGSSRTIEVRLTGAIPDLGRYVLEHTLADTGLHCNVQHREAVVPPFKYHFVLISGNQNDSNCADFNGDGDTATDSDIEDFFACLAGNCCPDCLTADLDCDRDYGTDADIETFFDILAGRSDVCDTCNP